MARNVFFFLMVGVFVGAMTASAIAGYGTEALQSTAAEDQMSAESHIAAVGGVADYWPEDQVSAEPRFAAVGGVADYWPEDGISPLAQERGPVETGALPERSEPSGNGVPTVEIGGLMFRVGIDTP